MLKEFPLNLGIRYGCPLFISSQHFSEGLKSAQ